MSERCRECGHYIGTGEQPIVCGECADAVRDAARAENDKLRAACAAKDAALRAFCADKCQCFEPAYEHDANCRVARAQYALSLDAGSGYVSPEQHAEVVAQAVALRERVEGLAFLEEKYHVRPNAAALRDASRDLPDAGAAFLARHRRVVEALRMIVRSGTISLSEDAEYRAEARAALAEADGE